MVYALLAIFGTVVAFQIDGSFTSVIKSEQLRSGDRVLAYTDRSSKSTTPVGNRSVRNA
ncbi:hypothetical protein [Actinomadura darangshiensis]|uniref:hypothetical protein n=1 Tax=Actinomadura darangshiensis TaxID=705336 RepID=UPI00140A4F4F|nr:hypothetical protein [Actinomadura darangshiensis]